jgi:hypothetical protein
MAMDRPAHIKNEQQWRRHCRQIVARSKDLIAGRLGVIETARGMYKFSIWLGVEGDADFDLFKKIDGESRSLPIGKVQSEWAPHALAKIIPVIEALEDRWRPEALAAAASLAAKYEWSLKRNLRAQRPRESRGDAI